MKNETIVLQIPGIFFANDTQFGVSSQQLKKTTDIVAKLLDNYNVLISVGSENFQNLIDHDALHSDRLTKDTTAQLAAQINGTILVSELSKLGKSSNFLIDFEASPGELAEQYNENLANAYLSEGNTVICTASVEHGLFDQDLAAALRVKEVNAVGLYKLVSKKYIDHFFPPSEEVVAKTYDDASKIPNFAIKHSALSFCAENKINIKIFTAESEINKLLKANPSEIVMLR